MLGQTLVERYRIDAELGKGGMGTVYRGYDTLLKRDVAIKAISSEGLGTEGRARLMLEARAVARLNHPNIVIIYDAVYEENKPYIIMELVEGKTLRAVSTPGIENSIEYARQICQALTHAHSKGIIHRDLKPENALLTPENTVKLMDFGLARSVDAPRVTQSGVIIGTIAYIAPELIEGEEPSPQSDLYALGVMLFEMLTGLQPFKGDDFLQTILQHIQAPIPSARELQPGIPTALDDLVSRLMSKAPQDRPDSALYVEQMLESLQNIQRQDTLPPSTDKARILALPELAEKRARAQKDWDRQWRKKGYPRSALPVLEPSERPLILSNREKELAKAVEHLKNHRLLIVNGMPGIGKSTFARALLEFMPVEAPPPFWYDFERQQSSGNTLSILLDRISGYLDICLGGDVRQEVMAFRNSPEGQASTYEVDVLIDYLNQDPPIWLVFDNLESVLSRGSNGFRDEGLEILFDGLKSNTHNARIIITNPFVPVLRNGQFLLEFGTQPLTLHGLSEAASITFLRTFGLENFSSEVLLSLVHAADGHPFTLNHLAHYIQALGVTSSDDDLQSSFEETTRRFKVSLQQRLSPQEFNALEAITVLHREISLDGLCQTAQVTPGVIKRLREEGLLQASDTGKFWLPPIVRNSVQAVSQEMAREAHARATIFYRSQKVSPTRQGVEDYASVLEWHHHAVQAGEAASSYEALFSTGLKDQLMAWNEYSLASELCEATLSVLTSGHKEISDTDWATLQHTLGIASFLLGKHTQSIACLETAIASLPDGENQELKLRMQTDLAESYNANGDATTARKICQQVLDTLTDAMSDNLKAKALQLSGIIYWGQGNMDQAIADLEGALSLFERVNDPVGIAYVTGELGNVYYYQNQFAKAILNHRRTINSCEARHDLRGAMIGHFNIGDILLQDERYELAVKELLTALTLARKKKIAWMELGAGLSLVEAQIALSQLDEAEDGLNLLKPLIAKQVLPWAAGMELALQASLHWKRERMDMARDFFKGAIQALEADVCQYARARAWLAFGRFLSHMQQREEAETALLSAKDIFDARNNQLGLKAVEKAFASI